LIARTEIPKQKYRQGKKIDVFGTQAVLISDQTTEEL